MPAAVQAASPSFVMPFSLCVAFRRSQYWLCEENRYKNGEVQRRVIPATSRKSWELSKRLNETEWNELRQFFIDQGGGMVEFWFYDSHETSPTFSYDETGAASTGRYAVRFDGNFQSSMELGSLFSPQLRLTEVS